MNTERGHFCFYVRKRSITNFDCITSEQYAVYFQREEDKEKCFKMRYGGFGEEHEYADICVHTDTRTSYVCKVPGQKRAHAFIHLVFDSQII